MMKIFGLTMEDYKAENSVDVCPDNWRSVLFFEKLGRGNWNMGPSGPTGLRYEAFREVRQLMKVSKQEWPEIFEAVRVMEQAALDEIYKD
jgi:hypothetical protein